MGNDQNPAKEPAEAASRPKTVTPKRLWRRAKTFLSSPANVILVIFFCLLLFFIFYPLFTLIYDTFIVSSVQELFLIPGGTAATIGSRTSQWWEEMIVGKNSTMYFWEPLGNSIIMSLLASFISITYGGATAFFITRTDLKYKDIIGSLFVLPYMMPSWTLATFWQNFWQNPNIGTGVGGMVYNFFGISVPSGLVYGLVPCSIVLGLHYAPFAYILIGGALRNMDANLEEAATILKASRVKIIRRITIPIVLPSIVSTFLLVFASSMSAYAVPRYIGGNVKFLTTYMKNFMNNGYNGRGYIIGIVMIILGVAILLLNQWITGRRRSFTTVSGKSGQISYIKLGKPGYIVSGVLLFMSFFCSILPLITFALESLCVKAGDYSTFTLQYWISRTATDAQNGICGILFEKQVWRAFGNSVLLALCSAVIAGSCGILIGYAVARRRGTKLAQAVDSLAFLPYLIPSMAMGAAFLTMALTFGWGKGFLALLVVASIKYLPFASRSGVNAMLQVSGEIEEAAVIVGVPWWKRMVQILFPIQKSTFISGYLLPFTSCMRELSLFVLLTSGSVQLLATLLDSWSQWWPQSANALNLLIILTVLAVNFIVNRLTGASLEQGVGG